MMFLVRELHAGPDWDLTRPIEQQSSWREHAAFMDRLVESGFVVLGGSLDALRVVLAVEAASESEVRATLADDPWMGSHLVVDDIEAWTIRLDARRP